MSVYVDVQGDFASVHVDVHGGFAMATFVDVYIAMARLILVLKLIKWTLIGRRPTGTLNH